MKTRGLRNILVALLTLSTSFIVACAEDAAVVPDNVTLQSNPLTGPSAAKVTPTPSTLNPLSMLAQILFASEPATAAVSSFAALETCVTEISFEGLDGTVGLPDEPLQPGLLSFSPTDINPMSIGTTTIPTGTVVKKFKFVIATNPTLCGTDYAVRFNDGTNGNIDITQDVSFEFDFQDAGGHTVTDSNSITLYLGDIVNAMVTLGATLDNSTIQTVDVGQAQ